MEGIKQLIEKANELETRASELPTSGASHVLYELCALVRRLLVSEPAEGEVSEAETIGAVVELLKRLPDQAAALRAARYAEQLVLAYPDTFNRTALEPFKEGS